MKSIKEFVEELPSQSSTIAYRSAIYTYLEHIYDFKRAGKRVTYDEMEEFEKLAQRYFSEGRNYAEDIKGFAISLQDSPPKTAKLYVAAIKQYFIENDVELTQKEQKRLRQRLPKGGAQTIEKDLDTDTLRSILSHMPVHGKALVLTLKSSGMRIGEALSLPLKDIDLKSNPPIVTIRGKNTKTGDNRITFIDKEAKEALIEWLKVRDAYLEAAINRNNGLVKAGFGNAKEADSNKLFPFSDAVALQIWNNALEKAGLLTKDEDTNRIQLHYHMLRKFFKSQLSLKAPEVIVEGLMGHKRYLPEYDRYTNKQKAEYYSKYEHMLYVSIPQDINELKDKQEGHEKIILELINKNQALEQQMERIEKDLQEKLGKSSKDLPDLNVAQPGQTLWVASEPGKYKGFTVPKSKNKEEKKK